MGDIFEDIIKLGKGLGQGAIDLFYKDGKFNLQNIALAGGLYGISRADDSETLGDFFGLGGGDSAPIGYTGGIPMYDYASEGSTTRELVPNAFSDFQRSNAGLLALDANNKNIPRRAGGKGRRYFQDANFVQRQTKDAEDSAAAAAAPAPAAAPSSQSPRIIVQDGRNAGTGLDEIVTQPLAGGGLASIGHQGYYLGGPTDGMADQIPAMIGSSQPAALSDGEFVIPADVVSHLGNGNSDAGAQELFSMMDRVRKARTGRTDQGKEINPNSYLA